MNTKFFTILVFCLLITGCVVHSNRSRSTQYQFLEMERMKHLPQIRSYKYTDEILDGTCNITCLPELFPEPKDLRESRDRYLKSYLSVHLLNNNLIYNESLFEAKYTLTYSYHTSPNMDGTFSHYFDIDIKQKNKGRIYASEPVWKGIVEIEIAKSSDISLYFGHILVKMFEKFPVPQSSWTEFYDKYSKKQNKL